MKRFTSFFILITSLTFGRSSITPEQIEIGKLPWLTGPLLAPGYAIVPLGHVNYEPFFFVTANTGSYTHSGKSRNNPILWENSAQHYTQVGLTSWMNFEITPTASYNYQESRAKWVFNDLPFALDIQLLAPKNRSDPKPYIKMRLGETFPTGKYRNLNPQKKGTDIGGGGTFLTDLEGVVGKLIHIYKDHFFSPSLTVRYSVPSPIRLKGFNAHGGGYGTNARFFPGQSFLVDLAGEFTLSRNWVLACDVVAKWAKSSHFSGNSGVDQDGKKASLGSPSSFNFSIAPALEYNFNAHVGLIGGSWFTIAGRNSDRFWSAVLAINYYR